MGQQKHYRLKNMNQHSNFKHNTTIITLSTVLVILLFLFVGIASNAMASNNIEFKPQTQNMDIKSLYVVTVETVDSIYHVRHEVNTVIDSISYDSVIDFYTQFTKDKAISKAIINASFYHDIPVNLAFAVSYYESGFDPNAINHNRLSTDRGLFQLNDGYRNWETAEYYNIYKNSYEGARYIKEMLTLNNEDFIYALYCYNAGPGKVRVHGEIPDRTRKYVTDILEYEDMITRMFNEWAVTEV